MTMESGRSFLLQFWKHIKKLFALRSLATLKNIQRLLPPKWAMRLCACEYVLAELVAHHLLKNTPVGEKFPEYWVAPRYFMHFDRSGGVLGSVVLGYPRRLLFAECPLPLGAKITYVFQIISMEWRIFPRISEKFSDSLSRYRCSYLQMFLAEYCSKF